LSEDRKLYQLRCHDHVYCGTVPRFSVSLSKLVSDPR